MNPPRVLPWYKAYCIEMVVMYLAVAAMGLFFLIEPPRGNRGEFGALGFVWLGLGVVFAAGYVFALLVPRASWGWVVGMIAICISLTSCACMPAGIPLLIFWLKPETKAWFGHPA